MATPNMSELKATLKVAVLMGGPSAEHEISLKSGCGVVEALSRLGWEAKGLVIPKSVTSEDALAATRLMLQREASDVVFIALHGPFGEDGTVQELCEELHVAYTGSNAQASQLGMDKVASRLRFVQEGLHVPAWQMVEATQHDLGSTLRSVPLPAVVKPTNQGSSVGISIVRTAEELKAAVTYAATFDHRVLIEQFIAGRELTVGILEHEALPVVEIQSSRSFFDYTAKYTPGLTRYVVPADLDQALATQIQRAGLRAHHALGCQHFSRIDLLLNEEARPIILEANTIPGLTMTSLLPKAAASVGIAYETLCERVILMAVQRRRAEEPVGSLQTR